MSYYLAPYRIHNHTWKSLDYSRLNHLISETRKKMLDDASKLIKEKKISNPDLYFLEKKEEAPLGGHDIVMAFFIGSGFQLTPILNSEGWEVFEKLKVSTSERGWIKRFKDKLHEMTTGEKPDPKSLNPY